MNTMIGIWNQKAEYFETKAQTEFDANGCMNAVDVEKGAKFRELAAKLKNQELEERR